MLSLTSFACARQGKSFSINAWTGFVKDSVRWSWYLFKCCIRKQGSASEVGFQTSINMTCDLESKHLGLLILVLLCVLHK